eukprot:SAG31_NODE_2061_length_6536_cov_20.366941_3_plen_238_part_00
MRWQHIVHHRGPKTRGTITAAHCTLHFHRLCGSSLHSTLPQTRRSALPHIVQDRRATTRSTVVADSSANVFGSSTSCSIADRRRGAQLRQLTALYASTDSTFSAAAHRASSLTVDVGHRCGISRHSTLPQTLRQFTALYASTESTFSAAAHRASSLTEDAGHRCGSSLHSTLPQTLRHFTTALYTSTEQLRQCSRHSDRAHDRPRPTRALLFLGSSTPTIIAERRRGAPLRWFSTTL